jgi:hypothetical protein
MQDVAELGGRRRRMRVEVKGGVRSARWIKGEVRLVVLVG